MLLFALIQKKNVKTGHMKKHTRLYLDEMNYDETDFIPCEVCGVKATDIHHIDARGMGGSKTSDYIENLMALCRNCHERWGDIKHHKDFLRDVHELRMYQRRRS